MSDATGREMLEILRRLEPVMVRAEERLRVIEARAGGPDRRLDAIEVRLGTIEAKLTALDGRISQLPTIAQTIGLVAAGLLGLVLGGGLLKFFLR